MGYALGGLTLLAGLYLLVALFARMFERADPCTLARALKWFAGISLAGLAALLFYAGRGVVVGGIGLLLLPFLRGWLFGKGVAAGAGSAGGDSGGAGTGDRTERRRSPRGGAGDMTREEAYDTLGLTPGCGREDIREAHRRLIKAVHPDHGGSATLAAKINQARDTLLGG